MTAPMPAVAQAAALTNADMVPPPDLAAAGPETDALTDTAMSGLEGTDAANSDQIGSVAGDGKTDQMAQMIPSLLGPLLGGLGGALSSSLGAVTQLPQAAMQGVQGATQSLSSLQSADPSVDDTGYDDSSYADDPAYADAGYSDTGGSPGGAGGDGGSAAPAAEETPPSSVIPVTGLSAAMPTIPSGAVTSPTTQPVAGTGSMMPMPMGGMGATGAQSAQTPQESPPKKLVTSTQPHTEPVAGKPPEERIAKAKPRDTVRRVTLPTEQAK